MRFQRKNGQKKCWKAPMVKLNLFPSRPPSLTLNEFILMSAFGISEVESKLFLRSESQRENVNVMKAVSACYWIIFKLFNLFLGHDVLVRITECIPQIPSYLLIKRKNSNITKNLADCGIDIIMNKWCWRDFQILSKRSNMTDFCVISVKSKYK